MGDNKERAFENVTADGKVRKSILVEGEGEPAGRGAKVTLRFTLYLSNDGKEGVKIDSSESRKKGAITFSQGRRKVIAALDAVSATMCVGEKCQVIANSAYAFGTRGLKRKGVPPDADIILDVEMISFEGGEKKKEIADMSPRELFEHAKLYKENGNALFKEVKYEKAMLQYSQCIRYVTSVFFKPKNNEVQEQPIINKEADKSGDVAYDTEQDRGKQMEAEESKTETKTEKSEPESSKDVVESTEDGTKSSENDANHADDRVSNDGFTAAKVALEETEEVIETLDVSTASRESPINFNISPTVESGQVNQDATVTSNGDMEQGVASPENEKSVEGEESRVTETELKLENEKESTEENDDPDEAEVKSLHVTALNNLSLCLVRMEQYKKAVESASVAHRLDPGNSKALYYR